jgi:hypothetical protein
VQGGSTAAATPRQPQLELKAAQVPVAAHGGSPEEGEPPEVGMRAGFLPPPPAAGSGGSSPPVGTAAAKRSPRQVCLLFWSGCDR